jgi:ribosomal protein S18 acetylase RimI-like enzyme
MATRPKYVVKELSPATWSDFADLFSRGNGWDFCWCMHFHRCRRLPKTEKLRRAERSVANHRDKKQLVASGKTHGVLVYANDGYANVEPVGWCQYGRAEELPRIDDDPNYRGPTPEAKKLWRITCFVVDKRYRRRGIAALALKAALASIKKQGGGLVEAYPVADWEGVSFGNSSTHGTVSMFEKQGFKVVGLFGRRNVVVRREV